MKFHCNPTSPFVRKVAVTLIELGLSDRVERVATNPRDESSGFWTKNPLAKIPALELDDGQVLYDSPVICSYLDEAYGNGRLSRAGEDAAARWQMQTLAALADGVLDAGVLARQETLRPESEQSAAWIDKQLAIASRGLDRLDGSAADFDDDIDLAAIGAGCAVAWLGFRHPQIDWLKGRDRLAAWYARFAERPSMAETAPG